MHSALIVCFFLPRKDLGLSAFSSSSSSPPFSFHECKKSVSKKIVSVMAPQQSERMPATTGSVSF
jgi:3-isopropylmalate/(R)-2-methylmalate dehydratase large subunit